MENEIPEMTPEIQRRVQLMMTLFEKDKIVDNFLHLDQRLLSRPIDKSPEPTTIPKKISQIELPTTFPSKGAEMSTKDFLDRTLSTGMAIIHKGEIVYENYWRGMTESTTSISWSVGKSFVSALFGIAIDEGLIASEHDMVIKYLPELKGTGYQKVSIKHCLQMSSGVQWVEDYADAESDIGRFTMHFSMNKPVNDYLLTVKPDKEPGSYNHYVSMDTQVLGAILAKVLDGKSLSTYLKEKIWDPIGMEHDAQWLIDETGMEFALGGLNVTIRDYAKLGLLYLNNGFWNGKQIVPAEWIQKSISQDGPHLQSGENIRSSSIFGYGYQWWIPIERMGNDYFASGIYNQHIYVNPEKEIVIAKTSANPNFNDPEDFAKEHYVNLFQTIAKAF